MTPNTASFDRVHRYRTNAELFGDYSCASRCFADLPSFLASQSTEVVALTFSASPTPAFAVHIAHVVNLSSNEHVFGVHAGWHVTFMTKEHAVWNWAYQMLVEIAVRSISSSIAIASLPDGDHTVSGAAYFALIYPTAVFVLGISTQQRWCLMAGEAHIAVLSRLWLGLCHVVPTRDQPVNCLAFLRDSRNG